MTFRANMNYSEILFSELGDLSIFNIEKSEIEIISDDLFVVKKTQWDYIDALNFQMKCVEVVQNHNNIKIFIFTSHPNCFTLGKGLQRSMIEEGGLVAYDDSIDHGISIPLHNIKRGGGITFHQPGQVVFYPIVNINFYKVKVFDFIDLILETTKETIEKNWTVNNLDTKNPLLGLWHNDDKIGSVGLHIKRFVTCHGLALNLWKDPIMWQEIMKIHPCGLDPIRYKSVEDISEDSSREDVEVKRDLFIKQFRESLYEKMLTSKNSVA